MPALHPDMTMAEIVASHPGARRALFSKYHLGGCRSCAFSDTETLRALCLRNDNLPVAEVLAHLETSRENDAALQMSPADLAQALRSPQPPRLVDVRSREEHEAVHLPGDHFLSQDLLQQAFATWEKSAPLVLYCHKGGRSLDLAAYFSGHGFTRVKALAGGIDAWSAEVDSSLPRYRVELESA